ncbi:alpha/beta hydrolase family protein, partial [Pseudomonas sp. CrR25]|nr:alpha/beta hydrolase family protein [Pseudomonas sp. CrR25]
NAGEETFLALWLPANVAEANGAVILLPGDAESVDWPLSVGPLRRKLPDAGWHSLSLSLPDPQGDVPPVRQVASANQAPQPDAAPVGPTSGSKDAADTATPAATQEPLAVDAPEARRTHHAERVLARIAAGIAFARQHQARTIVLLGHGSGAYWAARYLAEQEPDDVHNLLLVAAARPAGFSPPLEELIPSLKLATGDFYYQDRPDERSAALKRMQAGKRQKHPAYLQIAMQALPGNPTIAQEQLFRRIRGWLELHLRAAVATPGS